MEPDASSAVSEADLAQADWRSADSPAIGRDMPAGRHTRSARRGRCKPPRGAAALFAGATGFLLLGTYYFTKLYWGPAILHRLGA